MKLLILFTGVAICMEAENLRLKKTNTALRQALSSLQKSAEESVGAVASRGGRCGVGRVWNGRRCVPHLLEEHAEEDVAERGAAHYWRERTQGSSIATNTGNERPRGPRMEEGVGFFGTHKCLARNGCIAECEEDDPSKSRYSCMKECPKSLCEKEYDSHDHDHDGVIDHDSEDHNSDSSEENVGRSSRDSCLRGCQRLGAKDYAACEMRCRLETEDQVAYSAGRVTQTGSNKRCPCGNCRGRCCRCFAEQEENIGRSSRDSCLRGCQRLGAKDYAACEMRCRLETEEHVGAVASRGGRCGVGKVWNGRRCVAVFHSGEEKAVGGSWENGKCMYYGSYLTDSNPSVNDMGTGWSESSCQSECDYSSTTKACQYEFSSQRCLMFGFYDNNIYGAGDYDALCYVK